jgi:hypothetical protein
MSSSPSQLQARGLAGLAPIPPECVSVGCALGDFRAAYARREGRVALAKSGDPSGSFDRPSAIAEALVLWSYPDRSWSWRAIGSLKEMRDVGDLEVQAALAPNRNLAMREWDAKIGVPSQTPYVLVQVALEQSQWYGQMVGYMRLGEALSHPQRRPLVQAGKAVAGVWLIDADLLYPMPRWEAE